MLGPKTSIVTLAWAACATSVHAADVPANEQPSIVVIGTRTDKTPEKLDHILPEVDGTKITVTKKTSVTKFDLVPTIVNNDQRELFARTPGLFVSEQQTATQFNMSYRGLGNPQEAEFVLVLQSWRRAGCVEIAIVGGGRPWNADSRVVLRRKPVPDRFQEPY